MNGYEHTEGYTVNDLLEIWKRDEYVGFPKRTTMQHNAINDAKWNYELYKFLQKL